MTDLRIGQVGHGLGPRYLGAPRDSFPLPLNINLKFAKLRRGIALQVTLKRAKMQTSRPVVLNVGEIAPRGGFMRCGDDFVIYEIWGAISASIGVIYADQNVLKILIDSKKNCCFRLKIFDALSTPCFVTKVKEHMISDWWRNNQTNIVLCNVSLHQICKTTEIVTGWELSIVVLTKIIMNVCIVWYFVMSNI